MCYDLFGQLTASLLGCNALFHSIHSLLAARSVLLMPVAWTRSRCSSLSQCVVYGRYSQLVHSYRTAAVSVNYSLCQYTALLERLMKTALGKSHLVYYFDS
jgi:hypothetical protein